MTDHISIGVGFQEPFAYIEQNQWISPRVFHDDAATNLYIKQWDDHLATCLFNPRCRFLGRVHQKVHFLPLSFGLEDQFCIRFGQT